MDNNDISNKVYSFRKKQFDYLIQEENVAGGYEKWYASLEPFRQFIKRQYTQWDICNKVYRPRYVTTSFGDKIDHHALAYLAPLSFTRIGWNGKRLSPAKHLKKISDFFTRKGKRFLYVTVPNKGMIYPERIVNKSSDLGLFGNPGGGIGVAPQWRKYIKEVLAENIETLDLLPVFMKQRDEGDLFSKEHHISSFGAMITGRVIADYILSTTNIKSDENFHINMNEAYIYTSDYGNPKCEKEKASIYYIEGKFGKELYWNQNTLDSKIAIFGDCNLQSYCSHGAGISANLSYYLKYPIYNAGRKLIYGYMERPIKKEEIEELLQYDIIIYVNFSSAPFVRTAVFNLRHPALEYKWCNYKL